VITFNVFVGMMVEILGGGLESIGLLFEEIFD
jgi:hypothetical protein